MSARALVKAISPLRLSASFENTLDAEKRRQLGAHYTSEALALRVIGPLFLDDLKDALSQANTVSSLLLFLDRLKNLHCLDPACGTGNCLVVAYSSLRRLEVEAILRLRQWGVYREASVSLSQFCGIELCPEAFEVCQEALRLAERTQNDLAQQILGGAPFSCFQASTPRLFLGNALRLDWSLLLAPSCASYVFGNPPFVGVAYLSPEQQEDRKRVFAALDEAQGLCTGRLDYVASWYAKAIHYAEGYPIRMAFVSTNSLTQGEQARSMGPLLSRYGYHIDFAHRTFPWSSDTREKAKVHVVVLGFSKSISKTNQAPKRLFDYPDPRGQPIETKAGNINIWLADAPDITLSKRKEPLRPGYPIGTKGSQPTDGNHLLVEPEDYADIMADPIAAKYVRRYVQARDFLRGQYRWCLWLVDAIPEDLFCSAILRTRLERVLRARERSRTRSVRAFAHTPSLFTQIRQPKTRYLAIPEVSSENRPIIPAAFLDPDVIAGNKLIIFPGADRWLFGMLQSSWFMAWVRAVAGRMKSDMSISPHLTYCTFPFPEPSAELRSLVTHAAEAILRARQEFPSASLFALYEPKRMPGALVSAHRKLDTAVDALFGLEKPPRSEMERLAILFAHYSALQKEKPR